MVVGPKGWPELESIPLYRGGTVVSSLVGAFGGALRETRLTAMLGFIVARCPDQFMSVFRFPGRIQAVSLEANEEHGRSDIRVETSKGIGVVEAKRDVTNPTEQVLRYDANWRVVVTNYIPSGHQKGLSSLTYLRWKDIADALDRIAETRDHATKFLCREFKKHLEDHQMIRMEPAVEVYAREINEEAALDLFLKARMYGCRYEVTSRLPEARYFAPHFGRAIAENQFSIKQGISYIAKIEHVGVAENRAELFALVRKERGKAWLSRHKSYLDQFLRRWSWKKKPEKRSFVFLGEPRLIFNPPIPKERLQKGRGYLSKRMFSFDELFQAWANNRILSCE